MLKSLTASPVGIRLPMLLLASLLFAGCEYLGLRGNVLVSPGFSLTDGLAERISVLENGGQTNTSGSAVSLVPVVQVGSPEVRGTVTRSSHVSHDPRSGRLYVGYKLGGDSFGGQIDVVDLRDDGTVSAVRAVRSENVDVVEVRHDANENALFVAGAVNTRKVGASPALLAKVTPRGDRVELKSTRLTDFVAKSLVLGPGGDRLHVVTDENALFQFDRSLNENGKLTVGDASGFRSVAANDQDVFVLDRSGRIFNADAAEFSELSKVATVANRAFNERAIARLLMSGDRLFAALNMEGFSMMDPTGAAVWRSGRTGTGALYTCMAAGPEYLYVGRLDGFIEVYELPEGVPDQGTDLNRVETIRLWAADASVNVSSQSINQLLLVDGHLYVAYSTEGLLGFRVER